MNEPSPQPSWFKNLSLQRILPRNFVWLPVAFAPTVAEGALFCIYSLVSNKPFVVVKLVVGKFGDQDVFFYE